MGSGAPGAPDLTPEDLDRRGRAVYGEDWQSALARRLRVDPRTVRRWKAGDRAIPDWLDWAVGILERYKRER